MVFEVQPKPILRLLSFTFNKATSAPFKINNVKILLDEN